MPSIPSDDNHLAALQDALIALKKTRAKLKALEWAKREPIAIIGLACRFPGGVNTPEAFWQLLRDGRDTIVAVPADRWGMDVYDDLAVDAHIKESMRWGSFLAQVDTFDPQFFGISPREAESMDPQQRLILEVAWEALENASLAADRLVDSQTGVFIGLTNNDYRYLGHQLGSMADIDIHTNTGYAVCITAGRVSYILGLHGPSMVIDTACSSSLVAVHQACQSLRADECSLALVGGVNLTLSPETTATFSQMLAADGRCKTFDEAADGFVRGEGCGVIVLKRLNDALAHSDNILALIRGSAINQNGRSNGLTSPNGSAQQAVIHQALLNANIEPRQVQYVEAHGASTPLGDSIEVQSLAAVLCQDRSVGDRLAIGSVKTNIGTLEAAAGIAGLIKTVLALQHEEIPPHLHLKKPSSYIPWKDLPIFVPTEQTPWPSEKGRRVAGVSSFSLSGANAHVVLEEAPTSLFEQSPFERPMHLLCLSAKTQSALQALVGRYIQYLTENPNVPLADIAYTAGAGRSHFSHRLAVVGGSSVEICEKLSAFSTGQPTDGLQSRKVKGTIQPLVAFLFTGEGAQYVGMGQHLYQTQPTFRTAFDRCDDLLRSYLDQPLPSVFYPPEGQPSPLNATQYTQPALFALEYALAQMWRSWGIEPQVVLGHGVGEYVAGCVTGVFSLEDALKLVISLDQFEQIACEVQFRGPQIPMVSNVTGRFLEPDQISDANYWRRRIRSAVHFEAGMQTLAEQGYRVFVELGPSPVLSEMEQQRLVQDDITWLPSLKKGRDEWETVLTSLAQLHLQGVPIDWLGFDKDYARRRVPLPNYPFERKRCWPAFASLRVGKAEASGRTNHITPHAISKKEYAHTKPVTRQQAILSNLRALMARLLHMDSDEVDVEAHFLEMGADSLILTGAVSAIRETWGATLAIRQLFEDVTNITNLATYLDQVLTPDVTLEDIIEGRKKGPMSIGRASREGELPLSFGQERLWFLQQLEPHSALYNTAGTIRFEGALNVQALEQSLNAVVQRHEALRTTFHSKDGRPCQIILPELTIPLPVVDLSFLTTAGQGAEVYRCAVVEARRPFDLSQGPLLRVTLLRLNAQAHVLILVVHHIVWDRWSMAVFAREFEVLYPAFATEQSSPLLDLPLQYADYAVWQRAWLQGEVLTWQLTYWQQHLAEVPHVLELPTDRPRLAQPTYRGALHTFQVSSELTQRLHALSRREGATLFMTLLAAFKVLLYRYTGQTDIVVGTPIANRTRVEVGELIGFFVNTLALRTNLSGDPSFREVLERVREVALGAYAHQDVPFDEVVEALQVERSLSHAPVFQVMFALENTPQVALALDDLTITVAEIDDENAKFDLILDLWDQEKGLGGAFEYNTDLFDTATIVRLTEHYQTLLESIVADPGQRVGALVLLPPAARQQLLVEWNATQVDYPRDRYIPDLFEAQAARTPDAVAVVCADQYLTYHELNWRANQLAHSLRALNIGPDRVVGLCLERSIVMIVALLGLLKAGGAYVPLDPTSPEERLAWMVSDAQIRLLITQRSLRAKFAQTSVQTLLLDEAIPSSLEPMSVENPSHLMQPEHLAYVIYTSGSTGRPKGVMVSHAALAHYVLTAIDHFAFTAHDRVLQFTSISWDTAAEEIYPTLLSGATLVLRTEAMLNTVEGFLQTCATESVTALDLPTAYWHALTAQLETSGSQVPLAWRLVIVGGEAALADRLAIWLRHAPPSARLVNTYGLTEATCISTLCDLSEQSLATSSSSAPIGRPIANTRIYLLDSNLQPVPIGVWGEVHIAGPGLARGYLGRPELTAERFIPDPFGTETGARLCRTGDLARYRSDGTIEFLGRIGHQVKIRGFRVELGEIETVLRSHAALQEAVVLAREDVPGDKQLVAYIVPKNGQTPSASDWRDFLAERLPDYMVPAAFVSLATLPRTPTGKLDRQSLPSPHKSRSASIKEFVAPEGPLEERLAEIWCQTLRIDQISTYDNFFDLGGHSLIAMQLIYRMNTAFQIDLPLRSLFEAPTIAQMALLIEEILLNELEAEPEV